MAAELLYSAELVSPELLEQGRANYLQCPLRRSGQLEAPSAGTITIYDASGTVVVNAAAVTITANVANYTTGTLASSNRGLGWRIVWALTMPDGHVHTFRQSAALVRTKPYPTLSDHKIYERNRMLDPETDGCIHKLKTFQVKIDNTWTQLARELRNGGTWIHLTYDAEGLEEVHLQMLLAEFFDELGTARPEFLALADRARAALPAAWGAAQVSYDPSDSGTPNHQRRTARGNVWLCGR